jgi:hypothetical protein
MAGWRNVFYRLRGWLYQGDALIPSPDVVCLDADPARVVELSATPSRVKPLTADPARVVELVVENTCEF